MHACFKQLTRWLNVLLILTMLGSLLPPVPAALASATGSNTAKQALDESLLDPSPSLREDRLVASTAKSQKAELGEVLSTDKAAESLRPSSAAAFQTGNSGWYYPISYLDKDGEDIVRSGIVAGRHFTFTITAPDNLITGDENLETILTGEVPGPNEGGWDLTGDEHCVGYDFGVSFRQGTVVEALISGIELSSGGFPAALGRVHFYDPAWNYVGTLQWDYWWSNAGVKTDQYASPVRYTRVCINTGWSSDTPWWGKVKVKYVKMRPLQPIMGGHIIPTSQTWTSNNCPLSTCGPQQHFTQDPINTYSGNYNYQVTDLSVPTIGQPLRFERSYNSMPVSGTVVYSRPLGYGWTHNYDINLTFPNQAGGEPNTVILKAPHGSQLRFNVNPDGSYSPVPGVWASMTRQGNGFPHTYVITSANQTIYTFMETLSPFAANPITDLIADDGTAHDAFGQSVAISGNTAVVGADGEDAPYIDQGAGYIYERDGDGWRQIQKILSPELVAREYFGHSVAINGDTLLIGAPGYESTGGEYPHAYFFKRNSNGTWYFDTSIQADSDDGFFGRRVALGEDIGLIGMGDGGAVTIYDYHGWRGGDFLEVSHLPSGAVLGDDFAVSGQTAVVTAYDRASENSWVYVFERMGPPYHPVWNPVVELTSTEPDFIAGRKHVAINSNTIVVSKEDSTSPYVFIRNGETWSQQGRLIPAEPLSAGIERVAVDGNVAIFNTACQAGGEAYIFGREGATWSQQATLTRDDQCLGPSLAIHETITETLALFGAPGNDGGSANSGAAYLYQVGQEPVGTKLISIRDPQGNLTNLTYTGSLTASAGVEPALARVTDAASGRYLELGYDEQDRLASVSDHTGRTVGYSYDADNNLTDVTDTRNLAWTYTYTTAEGSAETPHYLHAITDPDGKVVERTFFDDQGRAVHQEDGLGRSMAEITYWGENRRVVMEAGKVTTDTYSIEGLLITQMDAGGIQDFSFDGSLNRNWIKDANGNETSSTYTEMGLTTSTTDALGNTTSFTYDANNNLQSSTDARNQTTTYSYDGQNNLVSTTNPLGYSTFYTYNAHGQQTSVTDENGQTTFYGYDALGQRTAITDTLGHVTRYEYDDLGRVKTTTDPLGKVTVNEYDAADNLIKVTENYLAGQPPNYQNEYNLITEYAYDGAGRQITITDTLSRVSRNFYDDTGRLERSVQNYQDGVYEAANPDEDMITAYGYDEFGRQTTVTDALGHITRTEYDAAGRVYRSIVNYQDGAYNSSQPDEDIVTQYDYDANGNVTRTVLLPGSAQERASCTFYDSLNRVERTVENCQDGDHSGDPADVDLVTAYGYDALGNQVVITNTRGLVTQYSYDILNRVETITNPLGGLTHYSYDSAGNRLSVTDAEGRVTRYDYDALNRVIVTTQNYVAYGLKNSSTNVKTTVSYDAAGNRLNVTDASGRKITFDYDSLYRLVASTDAENQTRRITYDALGNKLTETDPENQTTTYTYDPLNRLVNVERSTLDLQHYTYDILGNRLSVTDANNHTTTYAYDALNRLATTTDPNQVVTTVTYDGLGNRLSVTNGANETTEFEYDQANRLILTRDPLGNETEYRYDEAGNRIALVDAEGIETRYEYDDLDRLAAVTENYEDGSYDPGLTDEDVRTEYDYDDVGNRTHVTDARANTTTYVYDALNRRVEQRDPLSHLTRYEYDAAGNRTRQVDAKGVATTFSYDKVNRLIKIDYGDPSPGSGEAATPDVTFTYDKAGNRKTMSDGTGTTSYTYDELYRLTGVTDGANQTVGYGYDDVGNRTRLTYPDSREVTYAYDDGNRLETVTDWNNGQFGYDYDNANRLAGLTLPNGVESGYTYDDAGRLELLTHANITETIASYAYALDKVGNRTVLSETLVAAQTLPEGAFQENGGLVVMEAENFGERTDGLLHRWLLANYQTGYTGTAYLQLLPDLDATLSQSSAITASPVVSYPINFTTPGTYTVWLRGNPSNAGGDSAYVTLNDQVVSLTGFGPRQWSWYNLTTDSVSATLSITTTGVATVSVWMREDGLRIDRLLLTTDTTFIPTDFGPPETTRLESESLTFPLTHTIVYTYDNLYRLTHADYNTGESYTYSYDPVGNRLEQIINGDTTSYQYDAANRLEAVNGQSYSFDANGNLLRTGTMTNTFDAANRLVSAQQLTTTLQPIYNGVGDRVGQTVEALTTHFTLDMQGLPEVIRTGEGDAYLHLPGVIMTESAEGEVRYLLSDGLGSVRQATNEVGAVVAYYEFDPYGNPVDNTNGGEPYGYTGEWYEGYINLLHLRARWYNVGTGTFLSRDVVESEPPYQYVRGNPVNYVDPTGFYAEGEIEEYVNLPLFSVPTSLAEAGDLLHHLGHEPWLLKAIKHPLMVDLHAAVEGHLRRLEFFDQENLPGFYSTVRDEAKRLLLKDGLCGSVDVELEATHLAIIMIAAIPANEHNTPVRPKDLWALYPKFLPDGRWEEPGWDKTGHFFNHAFLTFEGLYMKERRMSYYSSLGQFHAALTFAVNPIPPNPIGGSNLREIDTLNAYYTFFSGPLYVNDITFYDALIGNVSFNDWQIYRMSRDIGLFYELFSTPYPLRSNQDIHYWILQQGHEINMDIIMQGLFDPGVLNDIAANKLGAKFGIRAYHNPLASPPGSMPPQ